MGTVNEKSQREYFFSCLSYDQLAAHSSGGGSDDQDRGKESL